MSEVPHPFVEESMKLFSQLSTKDKNKVYFIHFNHTNPALKDSHRLKDSLKLLGFNFAKQGDIFEL